MAQEETEYEALGNQLAAQMRKHDEQPENPIRSLGYFLDNRDLGVRTTMLHGHELVIGKLNTGYRPLTEAETSTVLALFALVALEWVAR